MAQRPGWDEQGVHGAAGSRSSRPVMASPPLASGTVGHSGVGGMVAVYTTGARVSAYADVKPSGGDSKSAPRKLWHASQGSSGG